MKLLTLVCSVRFEAARWLLGATGKQSDAWPHRLRHDVDVLSERLDALEQVIPDPERERDLLDLAARVKEWT